MAPNPKVAQNAPEPPPAPSLSSPSTATTTSGQNPFEIGPKAPNEADLDAFAEEEKMREATSGGKKKLKSKDILALLDKLSPDQLATVASAAAEAGLPLPVQGAGGKNFIKLANGSYQLTVIIDKDTAEQYITWAEGANEPVADFIQKQVIDQLSAFMSWTPEATA